MPDNFYSFFFFPALILCIKTAQERLEFLDVSRLWKKPALWPKIRLNGLRPQLFQIASKAFFC